MNIYGGFNGICTIVLLSAGIIFLSGIPSHAVGLGVDAYGCYGTGNIDSTKNDWYSGNTIEKKGDADYTKYGIGLVLDTSPFHGRFGVRLNPGMGFGRISKSIVRKEYDHDTGALLSTQRSKQKHNVIDYNMNVAFCFKVLKEKDFNLWIGPVAVMGKSRDIDKHYNDFYFGGGLAAGVNIGLTDSVYLTAGPSMNLLYSVNSNIDLMYFDCRAEVGVMMNL